MLAVITLNLNSADKTVDCVEALISQTPPCSKFIVVDNGSNSKDIDILKSLGERVNFILNNQNLGFAAGFNIGIKAALHENCDPILLINNDTIPAPGMIENLLMSFNLPNIGVSAPVIYYYEDPERIWSSGGTLFKNFLISLDPHSRREKLLKPTYRTTLTACCLMVKAEVLKQLNGFDEEFFLYYEDKDFFARLLATKWKSIVVPQAKLLHKVSLSSGGEYSRNAIYMSAKSSVIYYDKHINLLRFFPFLITRSVAFVYNSVKFTLHGGFQGLIAYVTGIRDGLKFVRRAKA